MSYTYPFYGQQPYQYQDQLGQLRAQPMQYQAPRPETGLNWVQGEAGAKSWFVTPGSTVLLMDSENQRFYLKSADMSGVPAMRTFEYSEIGAQQTSTQSYVTADEFAKFKSEILAKLESSTEALAVKKKKGAGADE